MHQLTLQLIRQRSAADTWRALVAALLEDFRADVVRVISFTPVAGLEDEAWFDVIPEGDPRLQPFQDCLRELEPICGRLNPQKQQVLYADQADLVMTTALLPVQATGLIAVGSYDPNRFYPGMGTLFLQLLGQAIPAVMARYEH